MDIQGLPTWVEQTGSGEESILLLHGGLSNSDDLLSTVGAALSDRYRVVAFDRRGHGRTADNDAPFTYRSMAGEAVAVLDQVVGGPAHLVGWSDGGIAALFTTMVRPDLVDRQVLIGTNYHHGGVAELDVDPSSDLVAGMAELYGERSPDGIEHFPVVLAKTEAMWPVEPTLTIADLRSIRTPTLVLVGDDDLVHLDHTVSLYESLRAAQLAVIPGTSHAVVVEAPAAVTQIIAAFLAGPEPPSTLMPLRRRDV